MKTIFSAALVTLGLAFAGSTGAYAQASNANNEPACNNPGMGADPRCTGVVPRGSVRDMAGFRTYVVQQRHPAVTLSDVAVGTVLPNSGVTYYEVPTQFGGPGLRYSIINGRTVLIDSDTRRVVQIID